jgi:probable O-glycosylation ligase (exosortase A-associated)
MRDIVLFTLFFAAIPFIVWRPTLGVFLWIWVSVMNPHRMTWGSAYDFYFAQIIAIATLVGMFFSRQPKRMPVTPVTVVLFLLTLWMCVTTLFALEPEHADPMWERVMKIQLMVFVSMYLLHSKRHVQTVIWIVAGSVAFFGVKGGLFTLESGGEYRVWGPPGSFIEENNSLALATIMTIPLLYYLSLLPLKGWMRWGLFGAMLLCGLSALGSYSRGGLLGITAMVAFLWSKTRTKFITGAVLVMLVPLAIGFMPEKWEDRMKSIQNYEHDDSSQGRINAWWMAFHLANDRPLVGGGFEPYNERTFSLYAPNPEDIHSAHSIYFQILGEHGYVGLGLFLLLWMLVWRDAAYIITQGRSRSDLQWAVDLARMIQVSIVGYAVGGAFLNLAYYDVPYYLIAALVITRLIVEKELQSNELKESVAAQPAAPNAEEGRRAVARARLDLR